MDSLWRGTISSFWQRIVSVSEEPHRQLTCAQIGNMSVCFVLQRLNSKAMTIENWREPAWRVELFAGCERSKTLALVLLKTLLHLLSLHQLPFLQQPIASTWTCTQNYEMSDFLRRIFTQRPRGPSQRSSSPLTFEQARVGPNAASMQ